MRSLQLQVSLSSLDCSVPEQRDHPCRTRRRTCQVTFASFPVAGVQWSTAVIASGAGKAALLQVAVNCPKKAAQLY